MRKRKDGGHARCRLAGILLLFFVGILSCPMGALAEEEPGHEDNSVYDSLKDRMETAWESGMEQIEGAEPMEVTGNLMERLLRSMAGGVMQNLKSIKAGALLTGAVSFVLGGTVALLARKDKKIRKKAVGICMAAIPGLLTVLVFALSWFASMFY